MEPDDVKLAEQGVRLGLLTWTGRREDSPELTALGTTMLPALFMSADDALCFALLAGRWHEAIAKVVVHLLAVQALGADLGSMALSLERVPRPPGPGGPSLS